MQDVHEILGSVAAVGGGGGSGGRIFGDRRLRAAAQGHHHHQALKCPRCDSLNTKFCYYNNYNLSQPRHFCKNCRRYWTKGGVLRNVPVGGGCRKSKRSSKRKASASPPPRTPAGKERHKSSSRSSSESTSANAASTGTKAQSAGCYAGAVGSGKAIGVATTTISEAGAEYSSSPLFKFSEQPPATFNFTSTARIPSCSGVNVNFEPSNGLQATAGTDPGAGGMFTEMGGFVSVMDGDQNQNLLGFGDVGHIETTPFEIHQQNQAHNQLLLQNLSARNWQKEKFNGVGDDWGAGIFDQTVYGDHLPNSRASDGAALAGLDWHGVSDGGVGGGGGHLGMFDLTPGSDWSQSSQWNESDHHLYLPP